MGVIPFRMPYEDQLKLKKELTEKVLRDVLVSIRKDCVNQVPKWVGVSGYGENFTLIC